MRINRVYTRSGDQGETSLVGGARVPKESARIEAYGDVDELNSLVGMTRGALERRAAAESGALSRDLRGAAGFLQAVQQRLFDTGNRFATPDEKFLGGMPTVTAAHVTELEAEIDRLSAGLPELTSFILPGGGELVALVHLARTVCRRAERAAWRLHRQEAVAPVALHYLNRLSDYLFVFARWLAQRLGEPEYLWEK